MDDAMAASLAACCLIMWVVIERENVRAIWSASTPTRTMIRDRVCRMGHWLMILRVILVDRCSRKRRQIVDSCAVNLPRVGESLTRFFSAVLLFFRDLILVLLRDLLIDKSSPPTAHTCRDEYAASGPYPNPWCGWTRHTCSCCGRTM